MNSLIIETKYSKSNNSNTTDGNNNINSNEKKRERSNRQEKQVTCDSIAHHPLTDAQLIP